MPFFSETASDCSATHGTALSSTLSHTSHSATETPLIERHPVERRVRDVFRAASYAELRQLRCKWAPGVLRLDGCVSSFFLKQQAQELVRAVDGVRGIENGIEVIAVAPQRGPR